METSGGRQCFRGYIPVMDHKNLSTAMALCIVSCVYMYIDEGFVHCILPMGIFASRTPKSFLLG